MAAKKNAKRWLALLLATAVSLVGNWQGGDSLRAYAAPDLFVQTVAGSGGAGKSGTIVTSVGLSPGGVAVNNQSVYLADYFNHVIRKVDKSTGLQTIVAGDGYAGYTGDGGPATSARLNGPLNLELDSAGNLYIVDSYNHVVRKLTPGGIITTVAGNGTTGYDGENLTATATKLSPMGIAVDGSGNLYIAESGNNRVRKVNTSGKISTVAGTGVSGFSGNGGQATAAKLQSPNDVAVDSAGNLYIADLSNNVVRKVTNGVISNYAGSNVYGYSGDGGAATSAKLKSPTFLTLDSASNLFITDGSSGVVRLVNKSTQKISTYAGDGSTGYSGDGGLATAAKFNYPGDVAIDGNGSLFIADNNNKVFRMVNSAGIISTYAGNGSSRFSGDGGGALDAQLNYPSEIAYDSAGNLYFSETDSYRIRKVDLAGQITTYAGNGTSGFSGDGGPASAAQLKSPKGLAFDAQGNLYVTDSYNYRIRKIALDGTITTVAGNGTFGYSGDGGSALSAQFKSPSDIVFDTAGNYYVLDGSDGRIRKIDAGGIITTVAGNGSLNVSGDGGSATDAGLGMASRLAIDGVGNIYVSAASPFNSKVRKIGTDGKINGFAGTGSQGYSGDNGLAVNATLNMPYEMVADSKGNVYIADSGNNVIRKVDSTGKITTYAGTGTAGFNGDGKSPLQTSFYGPQGLAFDAAGNMVVADYSNSLIRKIMVPIKNSTVTPSTATFDKNPANQADVALTLTANGNTLTDVYVDQTVLTSDEDYTVDGITVTLKKSSLSGLNNGMHTIKLVMSAGTAPVVSIEVSDTTPSPIPVPLLEADDFAWAQGSAVGSTQATALPSIDSGHTLKFIVGAEGGETHPLAGTNAEAQAYVSTLTANENIPVAANQHLFIAEVDATGEIVAWVDITVLAANVRQAPAMVPFLEPEDFAWAPGNAVGTTQTTSVPSVGSGHTLKVIVGAAGDKAHPVVGTDAATAGYADTLTTSGDIGVTAGQHLFVAEVNASGQIVAWTDITVLAENIKQAPGAVPTLNASEFAWAPGSTVGTTQTTSVPSVGSGHTLKVIVGAGGDKAHPVEGTDAATAGYADTLTASGDIAVTASQHLFIAEVDAAGKIVAWADVTVSTANIKQAPGAVPTLNASDFAWAPGSTVGTTQTTTLPSVGTGHTLKVVIGAAGDKTHPVEGTDATSAGYADTLTASVDIPVTAGQHLFIAEVDASGKIVAWADVTVLAANIKQAPGAVPTLNANDFAWAPGSTVGTTQTTALPSVGGGHTLKVIVGAAGDKAHPVEGTDAATAGYADTLTASSDIAVTAGQHLFIAKVDASGKIVAWADVTVTAANIKQAPGAVPTLNANDFAWAPGSTVGTTQTTSVPSVGGGHTLKVVIGAAGDKAHPVEGTDAAAAGYADTLTASSDIPVTAGQHLFIAEVDANGKIVAWADVTVSAENVRQATVPTIPTEAQQPDPGTTVLVNGSPQNGVAKAIVTTTGSKKSTVVQLDPAKLEALLASKSNGYVLTIPVQNGSGIVTGELNAQLIRNMADKEAVLEIRSEGTGYRLPASRIDVGALAAHFEAGISLSYIVVRVKIEMLDTVPATSAGDAQFISPAVEFTISATVADKRTIVDRFNGYVERTIDLPEGVDPNRITTGVVIGENGSIRHVPTKVAVEDGRYVAKINSLTNSAYVVVWHPLTFADAEMHWAKDAINDLGSRLVINGINDTTFAPNADMTRAEFAAIVVRGLGLPLGEGTASYLDVSSDAWYADAIRTASSYGLISGYPDGTFRPNDKLTREQAMTIIAKAMKLTGLANRAGNTDTAGALGAFADASEAGAWSLDSIASTVNAGLVAGQGDKLMPKANVSRAEVATLIQRLLQKSGLI
ncbi:S-layer homology domain-containing protein [Cohnella sp. GCM10020058]|uniref:NHL domain-containing protein n=1 Tax=Cohnella sp. GCM10020058 TaxID=3317330 RepID=UPI0036422953